MKLGLPGDLISDLFDNLQGLFPRDFALSIRGIEATAIKRWAKALDGYSDFEIEKGLAGCEDIISPPSVGQFRRLCRPNGKQANQKKEPRYDKSYYTNLQNFNTDSIAAKAEMRLIKLMQRQPVQDFEKIIEGKIDQYFINNKRQALFEYLISGEYFELNQRERNCLLPLR